MTTQNKYSRGSEWRKWDLHVHSPASGGFSGTWEQFETQLKTADCAVVGINDYCSVAGYKKIKDKINNGTLDVGDKKILPVVEFRMTETVQNKNTATNGVVHFNFHIVFDDSINVDDIENFIKSLKCEGTKISSDYGDSTKLKMKKVSFEAVLNDLNQDNKFKDRFMVWLPYDEYGGIDEIDPNSDGWIKGNYIQKAHILGSSRQKQIDFFHWKSDIKENGAPKFSQDQFKDWFVCKKACIKGSDSHSYDYPIGKLQGKDSNPTERYCWIKADPTFEGLKQIIYEPTERVRLCEQNPGLMFDKPHFDSLCIGKKMAIFQSLQDQAYFEKEETLLNKNLVAIIGGRGSGKSLLVDYLAATFGKKLEKRDSDFIKSDKFKVVYAKNNLDKPDTTIYSASNENYLDFLYIPQGKLKSIVKSGSLNEEIKSLLELETLSFSEQTTKDIASTLQNIKMIHAWFNEVDEFGEKANEKKIIGNKKDRYEKLLESITTKENEKKLELYSKNVDALQALEEDKTALAELRNVVAQSLIDLNEQINILKKYKIPEISGTKQIVAIDVAVKDIILKIKEAEEENKKIREEFKEIYTGDLSKLLKNVEVYRKAIKVAEQKLMQIEKQEIKFKELLGERSKLGLSIGRELKRQSDLITDKWSKILDQFEDPEQKKVIKKILSDREIIIKGEILFNKDKFYELLQKRMNMLYFKPTQDKTREQKIIEWADISDLRSFEKFISERLSKQYEDEEDQKKWLSGVDPSDLFFSLSIRSQYLYTQASVTYKGKPISKLSAGQRGTTFLCIQLARNAFSSPIVFDQPEDDLDNEFIIEELVDIFKTLKLYRQIIIVTHNANLVVNADAEQVIVASNKDEGLSYSSGSLENQEIIKSACAILEGGKDAFEKRKNKYTAIQ